MSKTRTASGLVTTSFPNVLKPGQSALPLRFVKDHDRLICLEELIGPQDDLNVVGQALGQMDNSAVVALSEALTFDPKDDLTDQNVRSLFRGHLKPVNVLPVLLLVNNADSVYVDGAQTYSLTHDIQQKPDAAEKWKALIPSLKPDEFGENNRNFQRLTPTEFQVLTLLVENDLQDDFEHPKKPDMESFQLVALETDITDIRSLVHIGVRAIHVLEGKARTVRRGRIREEVGRLRKEGEKSLTGKSQSTGSRTGLKQKVTTIVLSSLSQDGLAVAVSHNLLPKGLLDDPELLVKKLNGRDISQIEKVIQDSGRNIGFARHIIFSGQHRINLPEDQGERIRLANEVTDHIQNHRAHQDRATRGKLYVTVFPEMDGKPADAVKMIYHGLYPPSSEKVDLEDLEFRLSKAGHNCSRKEIEETGEKTLRHAVEYMIFPGIRRD